MQHENQDAVLEEIAVQALHTGNYTSPADILKAIDGKKWPKLLEINIGMCANVHGWIDKMLALYVAAQVRQVFPKGMLQELGLAWDPIWTRAVTAQRRVGWQS